MLSPFPRKKAHPTRLNMATTDPVALSLSHFLTEAALGEPKMIFGYSGIVCVKKRTKANNLTSNEVP